MTLNVGVIGTGMIGQDHIRRLTTSCPGRGSPRSPTWTLERARTVADGLPGARRARDRAGADRGPAASTRWWSPRGVRPTRSTCSPAIAAGKQVFCEKPLATTQEACDRILDAEVARGRRLVHGRVHAPVRRAVPGDEGRGHQRGDRGAAAHARRAPQPVGAAALHQRDDRSTTPRCTTSTWRAGCSTRRSPPSRCSSRGRAARPAAGFDDPLLVLLEMAQRRARRRRGDR